MIVSFDENVQERDCIVLFKFIGEFDICVTVIEVVQELGCRVFIVEQGESIVYVSFTLSSLLGLRHPFPCSRVFCSILSFKFWLHKGRFRPGLGSKNYHA